MATASDQRPAPAIGASNLAEIPEEVLQRRYQLTRAELNAIKKALAPEGTSDYEVMLYVGVCNRLRLDPFVPGLVHFAKFWNKEHTSYRVGIILGVYGYIAIAQQDQAYDGFAVKSFPDDVEKPVTHATCSVFRKGSSHPVEVTVLAKEARSRSDSKNWNESPRHMTENAAIRRAMKYAYPTLFGAVDEEEDTEDARFEPPEVRGRVGTFLGEHHDVPALPPVETPAPAVVPAAPVREPVLAEARPARTQSDIEGVATAIAELMDDPGLPQEKYERMRSLLGQRLDTLKLWSAHQGKPENFDFLSALLTDIRQIHDQG